MPVLERRFQFQIEDLRAGQVAFVRGRRGFVMRVAMLPFAWMAVMGISASPGIGGKAYAVLMLIGSLALIARPSFIPLAILQINRRRIRALSGETTLRFSEEQVEFISPGATSVCSWSLFRSWRETRQLFLLYWSRNAASVVPKRVFSEQEQDFLRGLLEAHARRVSDEPPLPTLPPLAPEESQTMFRLERRDLVDVMRVARRGPFLRWFYRVAAVLGLAWSGYYAYYELTTHALSIWLTVVSVAMGLAFTFAGPLSDLSALILYRRADFPESILRIRGDAVRIVSPKVDVTLRVADLLGFRETSRAIVLQTAPMQFHAIPKRTLQPDAYSTLMNSLARSTRNIR